MFAVFALVVLAGVVPVRAAGIGEVGGAERGAPDAVEVVLGFAQVQGEGVVEEAEAGQGFLKAVDGAGGRFEVVVQVGGGGVVGCASTRTTEIVYRRELRPVITTGAEIMDQLFTGT